jgi:hypothetical protein
LSVNESDHDKGLCNEVVIFFHEIFSNKISPTDLIVDVLEHWSQNFLEK